MTTYWLILAACVCLVFIAFLVREAFGNGASDEVNALSTLRALAPSQYSDLDGSDGEDVERYAQEGTDDRLQAPITIKVSDTRVTLQKRLRFANLSWIPSYVFALAQICISVVTFLLFQRYFYIPLQLLALTSGPLFVNWFINSRIESRFKRFDKDFPQFLVSLVGMLKTGLNPVQGLEVAGLELENSSLVRQEVELLLERLRIGVTEERSVGSFGEDISHPEIELFVQAFLLSRRVGGNLSDTMDRLARQVRKRQFFRGAAKAAVGLQRGSILFILCLLGGLEGYLYFAWRESVVLTWTDPAAAPIAQMGLAVIFVGLYWVMQVTKIRV